MKKFFISVFIVALSNVVVTNYDDILSEAKIKLNCSKDISLVEYNGSEYYAHAYDSKIMINKKVLDGTPLGFRRMIIFHEVVHIAYKDYLLSNLIKPCVLFGTAGLIYAALSNVNDPYYRTATGFYLGAGLTLIARQQYSKFMKTRADTKAAHALGCEICLHEVNDYLEQRIATNTNEATRTDKDYLSGSQFVEIAKKFKNQRCQHHKANR